MRAGEYATFNYWAEVVDFQFDRGDAAFTTEVALYGNAHCCVGHRRRHTTVSSSSTVSQAAPESPGLQTGVRPLRVSYFEHELPDILTFEQLQECFRERFQALDDFFARFEFAGRQPSSHFARGLAITAGVVRH